MNLNHKHIILIVKYYPSKNGRLCSENAGIQSAQECKEAQRKLKKYNSHFKESMFAIATGNGYDLPFGCISDTVSQKHYVYWNAEGNAISSDPRIKQICKHPNGKYSYKTYQFIDWAI